MESTGSQRGYSFLPAVAVVGLKYMPSTLPWGLVLHMYALNGNQIR